MFQLVAAASECMGGVPFSRRCKHEYGVVVVFDLELALCVHKRALCIYLLLKKKNTEMFNNTNCPTLPMAHSFTGTSIYKGISI